ncbi:DMT family transporter [Streptomyces sp. NPDC002677]|uniref:DMT family transporter n=1 Tax=Streptomyces sp. NPDC002677 TaxID=3154774 RepID=UPI003322338A
MSALALSVLLSFVSAVAYAGGAIVQEQVAVTSPDEQYAPLRRPSWWGAMALNGLGGVLHVVALAYGPLSLVQPLGALTIVFALPMAALFVGRKAGSTAWRGAIMATVGLAGLLSLVGSSDSHTLDSAGRTGVAVVTGGAIVALMVAGRAAHRHPAVRSVLLAVASGIAFGMSSVFTKVVAIDWDGGLAVSDALWLAVIGVYAVAGVMISQSAYRGGGLAAPLATLTVVNPVLAAAVGITMFDETFRYGTTGTLLALACGVVAMGGLILLTTDRLEHAPADTAPEPETSPEPLVEALVELAEAALPKPNLPEAHLTAAGMTETGLAEAGMTEADLTTAGLADMDLTAAGLTEAGLAEAGTTEAGLAIAGSADVDLAFAGLTQASLTEAGTTEADLTTAGLADMDLTAAGLTQASLTEAGTTEADLTTAGLADMDLTVAGLTEAGLAEAGMTEAGLAIAGSADVDLAEAGLVQAGLVGGLSVGGGVLAGAVADGEDRPARVEMPQQRTASVADVADVLLPAAGFVPAPVPDRHRMRVKF